MKKQILLTCLLALCCMGPALANDEECLKACIFNGKIDWQCVSTMACQRSQIQRETREWEQKIKKKQSCPWQFKVIPEPELESWLNKGWQFESVYAEKIQISGSTDYQIRLGYTVNKAIIKRRVCP